MPKFQLLIAACFLFLFSCKEQKHYDAIIRNGLIYDGSGAAPVKEDVGINADTIAFIGDLSGAKATNDVDAKGMAVAPGLIDMQSQSMESLIQDGRSLAAIKQGVTLEVFGEGESMGPLNDTLKAVAQKQQGDIKYKIEWTTLREYLEYLQKKGISTNVASFLGAATIRENLLMFNNRAPDSAELNKMRLLVKKGMQDGALGIGSALIYAPGTYAKTDELIELCKVARGYGGVYISHVRSEGNQLLQAADELIKISKEANIPAIIWHLKAAGKPNWPKMGMLIKKIDSARKAGLDISACMYTYTAGATGFDAAMPTWVQEGGLDKWVGRLKDPVTRKKLLKEMGEPSNDWENLYLGAGPENIICTGFKQDSLKYLTGKRLSEIAKMRGKTPEETILDLIVQDHSRIEVIYFLMSEDNVKKQLQLPYVSLGSDAPSMAPEGVFLKSSTHPRAYGNFARMIGHYVRNEKLMPLEEAIRKMTSLAASQLHIKKRGALKTGNYADVIIFDPSKVNDLATYEKPHQLSTGMIDVFVNGSQVLKDGEHTGAKPGRAVFGPGLMK
ncbi:MAG: D-aminoacylase [Bacteroidetes bacterium]|nr:D-aminoacylase [Bacteroidota bacterium]MBS1974211.1 D-aminoacylase [Bacteroidota bacterium]